MKNSTKNTYPKVYFDANILLELILLRPKHNIVKKLIEEYSESICISTLSVHLLVYFGIRNVDIKILEKFIAGFEILSLENSDVQWSFSNIQDNDFEDGLQLSTAIRNNASDFFTLDKKLYNNYKNIKIINIHLVK